jgi:hypothetical protein
MPLVDANASLVVSVTPEDVKCSTPRDHQACAIAQAIKRNIGRKDTQAVIYKSRAHVLMPCDAGVARANKLRKGMMAWHRFRVTPETMKQIVRFDRTGKMEDGVLSLRAPDPANSYAGHAKRNKAWRAKHPEGTGTKLRRKRSPWVRTRAAGDAAVGGA